MKGIELCEKYYERFGNGLIASLFKEYQGKISAGVAGSGSEFFSFDDEISEDHNFYAGFYFWLTEEQDREIGFKLMKEYEKLPKEFMGRERGNCNPSTPNHFGVIKIGDFFYKLVGKSQPFDNWRDWFYTPSYSLACATNGKIFENGDGSFKKHRDNLLAMPEDVKLKKISAHLALMAQCGQYNFERCAKRGEIAGGVLSKNNFVIHTALTCNLLQNKYSPFYKWLVKSVGNTFSDNIQSDLTSLLIENDNKKCIDLIEKISFKIHQFLKDNDYITNSEEYLENSAFEISCKIKNREIRSLHMMDYGQNL